MPQSSDLYFASSNKHKYQEAKKILQSFGIDVTFYKIELEEIQSDSLSEIASRKAAMAFGKLGKPVIVEDDGLFVDSLGGFPGPYSSYVFRTIGNKGMLSLVKNCPAKFVSVISFSDGNISKSFEAKIDGKISTGIRGDGWGYDPIFVPHKSKKTFAELENKNDISHRYKALKKFASWYKLE
ncbi:MAG: RdgB/HAM1 family non-canonical purine NTP pyrophosphatase [Nitrosarchaeum sp.]|nr:RdgB/HAM1 family non-canonical purine NTP pyrophosphatase [Nitrosarchaeum sp.]